jgi:hypothetical protein
MYGIECWRMTESDINKLSSFHNEYLRKILRIFWPAKITNKNLYEITKTTDMRTLLRIYRWGLIGHILRKPTDDITRVALRWTPEEKRRKGRAKTTCRRTVEKEILPGERWRR